MAPHRRKFTKFNVEMNMQSPPPAQAVFEFIKKDEKLPARVFPVEVPRPDGFRAPDQIWDHIDLVKAYLLAGANDRNVPVAEFERRFLACFPPGSEMFKVVATGNSEKRSKDDEYLKMCKIKVYSFVEFVSHKEEIEDARLDAINKFRGNMAFIMTLFNEFVDTKMNNLNATPAEISKDVCGRAHFAVKVGSDGTIVIPGFCSFQKNHAEFVDYLQFFCAELCALNPDQ